MKKKIVEIILLVMATATFAGCGNAAQKPQEEIEQITQEEIQEPKMIYLDDYVLPEWEAPEEVKQIMDTEEFVFFENCQLSEIGIDDRGGAYFIELCIAQVEDIETGEGRILNYWSSENNYIYVGDMPEMNLQDGDIVAKYYIYNPDTDIEDDIINEYSVFITDTYRK